MISFITKLAGGFMPHIIAGLGIASLLACGWAFVQGERMHGWKVEAKAARRDVETAVNALRTSEASLKTVTAALNRKNAESDARAKALRDAITRNAADIAFADANAKKADASIATLMKMAAANPKSCPVPADLAAALQGL